MRFELCTPDLDACIHIFVVVVYYVGFPQQALSNPVTIRHMWQMTF
jgi:hypothetical protein